MAKPPARPLAGVALVAALRAKAQELGFAALGLTTAQGDPRWTADLTQFLAEGRQAGMAWLAARHEHRISPVALWPEARSVIVLAENYGPGRDPLALRDEPERGVISVYAQGQDYHDVLKRRLKALARWLVEQSGAEVKVFTDTAPVLEKPLAARAGLGWQGRNTHLVSRRFGSWLFLGEIMTTLDLPPDPPSASHCGRCTACETACPTGALQEGRIDPRLCLSYLTIEHAGPIDPALRPALGNRIYGCDDCTAVCPWNKFSTPGQDPAYFPRVELLASHLTDWLEMDDAAFRAVLAGSPIKRIGRARFLRNVLYALGNSGQPAVIPRLRVFCEDPDPVLADAAAWSVTQLSRL